MSESKTPSGIDRLVGQRIRWRRRELKLTQERLGELLELTFQQVQKYEKGTNRISAGRLFELSSVLQVPVTYFYDDAEEFLPDRAQTDIADASDVASTGEVMDFISALQDIADPKVRQSLLSLVRATADSLNSETVSEPKMERPRKRKASK